MVSWRGFRGLGFGHWRRCCLRLRHRLGRLHRRSGSFLLLRFRFSLYSSFRFLLRAFLCFTSDRQMIAPSYCRGWSGNKAWLPFRARNIVYPKITRTISVSPRRYVDCNADSERIMCSNVFEHSLRSFRTSGSMDGSLKTSRERSVGFEVLHD